MCMDAVRFPSGEKWNADTINSQTKQKAGERAREGEIEIERE